MLRQGIKRNPPDAVGGVGGIWADVEPCPGLEAVFCIPGVQDIPMMLFFQLVGFLSKGFNVLIFLLQV